MFATEAIHRAAEVAQQEQEEREGAASSKKGKSKEVVPPGMLEVSRILLSGLSSKID